MSDEDTWAEIARTCRSLAVLLESEPVERARYETDIKDVCLELGIDHTRDAIWHIRNFDEHLRRCSEWRQREREEKDELIQVLQNEISTLKFTDPQQKIVELENEIASLRARLAAIYSLLDE